MILSHSAVFGTSTNSIEFMIEKQLGESNKSQSLNMEIRTKSSAMESGQATTLFEMGTRDILKLEITIY